ncbi:Mariner Mos1 transposase [Anthophora quadrimaculata]
MTVFFDCRDVVHSEFLPPGLTVNKEYYVSVLKRLRENVRRKRSELWRNNSWFLHHDNAPAHTSHLVRDYLTKNNVNTVPQAAYSPDMAPCDFFLFARLKLPLRGKRFQTIEAIKEKSQKELKAIPKSAYENCFEDWKKRWNMKKVRYANAMFSGTPDAEYVYSHVKTSMLHPQFPDKSREKRAYSFCKNYPNSFHDTLIP